MRQARINGRSGLYISSKSNKDALVLLRGHQPKAADKSRGPNMAKILVVDDEHSVRHMLREMLESDHDISEASNGKEAYESYLKNPTDLVITDLVMPEKSGIDLILELKRKNPHIRILAISGGGGLTGRSDYLPIAKLIGAEAILSKPFLAKELRTKIDYVLNH